MKLKLMSALMLLVMIVILLVGCDTKKSTTTTTSQTTTTTTESTTTTTTTCYHQFNTNPLSCTEDTICSICGGAIPATGHHFTGPGVYTAGTCEEYGYTTYKCHDCDETKVVTDTVYAPHKFVDGVCTVCGATSTVTVAPQPVDTLTIPDKYSTGAGSIKYPNETIVPARAGLTINGAVINPTSGNGWNVNVASVVTEGGEVIISNVDFSSGQFRGVTGYGTNHFTVTFVNCIFDSITTGRNEDIFLEIIFDHCTLVTFNGSSVWFDWCYFGGNDYRDGLNPFQDVKVTNCFSGEKCAVKYDSEMHTDFTQIYGYGPKEKTVVARDQYYYNVRVEMPAVRYTQSKAYSNSILMVSLDYNDADNIIFDHCTINGGGAALMTWDNPHPTYVTTPNKMTNILYNDINYGCTHQYTNILNAAYGLVNPESQVTRTNINPTEQLYVCSVWKDDDGFNFSVSNDTNQNRMFTIVTANGVYSYEVRRCPIFLEYVKDMAYSEFPFDIKFTIDDGSEWAVCYDTTDLYNPVQIRFYNENTETPNISLDLARVYNDTSRPSDYLLSSGTIKSTKCEDQIKDINGSKVNIIDGQDNYGTINSFYTLDSDGTFTVYGNGASSNYAVGSRPYEAYINQIKKVVFKPGMTTNVYNYYSTTYTTVRTTGVTSIGMSMFEGCVNLTEVVLHSDIESIGSKAFAGCTQLTDIVIPYGTKTIGTNCFSGDYAIESIVIPSTVTSVGVGAFRDCISLNTVYYNAKSSILGSTFAGCNSLEEIWLSADVTSIDKAAFTNSYALRRVKFCGTEEQLKGANYRDKSRSLILHSEIQYVTPAQMAEHNNSDYKANEPKHVNVGVDLLKIKKVYDGNPFDISLPVTIETDAQLSYKWMQGAVIIDGAPTECGRYVVVITAPQTENYRECRLTFTVYIDQATSTLELGSESLDKKYDGAPVNNPTYQTNSDGEVTIVWKSGVTEFSAPPSAPGTYTVTVTVKENNNFSAVSKSMVVTISLPDGVSYWDGSIATSFAGGNGTEESPYLIATPEQLALLSAKLADATTYADYASAYYRLTSDIYLNEGASSYTEWKKYPPTNKWNAIGITEASAFKGHFEGSGHTIFGMYTMTSVDAERYANGLFGYLKGATVRNLNFNYCFAFASTTGSYAAAILASYADGVTISGINVDQCTTASRNYGAGLFGQLCAKTGNVLVERCNINIQVGYVSAPNTAGGLAAYVSSTKVSGVQLSIIIRDCTVRGHIEMEQSVGGFIGRAEANTCITLERCVNYADVVAFKSGYASGIIGRISSTSGGCPVILINCQNFGNIYAVGSYAGGLISNIIAKNSPVTIDGCANFGNVTATENYAGGLVGHIDGTDVAGSTVTILDSFSYAEVTSLFYNGGIIGYINAVHPPMVLDNCVTNSTKAISNLTLDGTSVWSNSKFASADSFIAKLNENAETKGYLVKWTQGIKAPKAVSVLDVSDELLDKYTDGTPVKTPDYSVLVGDGKVTVEFYRGTEKLNSAPSEAGEYRAVITLYATDAYIGSSFVVEFTLTEQNQPTLRIDNPTKTYDGTPVANPAVYTTNEGAPVTYEWYSGEIGYGMLLAGAPTEAGKYYVIVTVGPTDSYPPIMKTKAFTIDKVVTTITGLADPSCEYTGSPVAIGPYTFNGDAMVTVKYYKGTKDMMGSELTGAPTEVGYYTAHLTAPETANYTALSYYLEYRIDKITVTVAITNDITKQYDGNAALTPSYLLSLPTLGTVTITYSKADGTILDAAPTEAGSYKVTVTVAADGNYTGASVTKFFDIWRPGLTWDGSIAVSFAGGNGTEANPFLIATPSQLAYLASLINGFQTYSIVEGLVAEGSDIRYADAWYKLTDDIVLNENAQDYATWSVFSKTNDKWELNMPANMWTAIGNSASAIFEGHFDGSGKTISGLFITATVEYRSGLFGNVNNAAISNINIRYSSVNSPATNIHAGTLVCMTNNSTFTNINVTDAIVNAYTTAGGVIGGASRVVNVPTTLINVHFSGNVNSSKGAASSNSAAGGLIGRTEIHSAWVIITNCTVRGEIYSYDKAAGILVNTQTNPSQWLTNCTNYATVTSVLGDAAGMCVNAGFTTGCNIVLYSCANYGNVSGALKVGGLLSSHNSNSATVIIENCANYGEITTTGTDATKSFAGGLIGQIMGGVNITISNCLSAGTVSGTNAAGVIGGITSTTAMKLKLTAVYYKADKAYAVAEPSNVAEKFTDAHAVTVEMLSGAVDYTEGTKLTAALQSWVTAKGPSDGKYISWQQGTVAPEFVQD